jgi:hypothetical protein
MPPDGRGCISVTSVRINRNQLLKRLPLICRGELFARGARVGYIAACKDGFETSLGRLAKSVAIEPSGSQ